MSARPLDRVVAALRASTPRAGATRVLAIDGRSGAGKSTLARALARDLGDAPVVSLEDLYDGWDALERGVELLRSAVLIPLAAGRWAEVPRYDWQAGSWGEPWRLEPPSELIVEGCGAGATALVPYLSVLVWIELGAVRRRERVMSRADWDIYEPHWRSWAAQEDDLLARERTGDRADLVIGGDDPGLDAG